VVSGAFLKDVALFQGLTDEQIEKVAAICREETYQKGQVILQERSVGDEMYVITQGMVEILLEPGRVTPEALAAPEPTPILSLGKGQVFGEMGLVDQGARSATVRCVADDTRLLAIRRDDFMRLCEEDPRIGYVVMRNIAADLSFKLRIHNLTWKQ